MKAGNVNRIIFCLLPVLFLIAPPAAARPGAPDIRIDGRFDDWEGLKPAYQASPDLPPAVLSVRRVWVINRGACLFFRIELTEELLLQSGSSLILALDTDNSLKTGLPIGGIGADFCWRFDKRTGSLETPAGQVSLNPYEIGIVTAPTVSSREFEISLRRDASVGRGSSLLPGAVIRWVLADGEGAVPAVRCLAAGTFTFSVVPPASYPPVLLAKEKPDHLRIASYNVLRNGLFKREEIFSRILKALNPDVIAFQEIRREQGPETRRLMTRLLGGTWYAAQTQDTVTVSRYPINRHDRVDGNHIALIRLTTGRKIILVNAHLPSGAADQRRQAEADAIMARIREARRPGGRLTLDPGTPIVIIGDLNLVGSSRQLETLVRGAIADTDRFGPACFPDWDGTALADLLPYHLAAPEAYTWWADETGSRFGPGRLDFILYTDSVLFPVKSFILRTESMPDSLLGAAGLQREDTARASDHLPVVADFIIKDSPPVSASRETPLGTGLPRPRPSPVRE